MERTCPSWAWTEGRLYESPGSVEKRSPTSNEPLTPRSPLLRWGLNTLRHSARQQGPRRRLERHRGAPVKPLLAPRDAREALGKRDVDVHRPDLLDRLARGA